MTTLDAALGALRSVPCWFLWRLEWDVAEGKYQKTPCRPDGSVYRIDASNPGVWMSYHDARSALDCLPRGDALTYTLGFYMKPGCGWFFLDLDKVTDATGKLLPFAERMIAAFPGALVEWSSSRKGVHIIGRGVPACNHRTKPERSTKVALSPLELEFYTKDRGIAFGLTGEATGNADTAHDATIAQLCSMYFPARAEVEAGEFDTPRAEWRGPSDDDELIRRALAAQASAAVVLGGKVSFAQLWKGECEKRAPSRFVWNVLIMSSPERARDCEADASAWRTADS